MRELEEARNAQAIEMSAVEAKLREEVGRREEMTQAKLRAEKAAEDERGRHVLTRRAHEENSSAVLTKISEQGQQVHTLQEALRSKDSECAQLKLCQSSADNLIGTFKERCWVAGCRT